MSSLSERPEGSRRRSLSEIRRVGIVGGTGPVGRGRAARLSSSYEALIDYREERRAAGVHRPGGRGEKGDVQRSSDHRLVNPRPQASLRGSPQLRPDDRSADAPPPQPRETQWKKESLDKDSVTGRRWQQRKRRPHEVQPLPPDLWG